MKTFEKLKIGMAVISTAALALALPVFAESKEGESEEEVKLTDCPAAVQKTINDNAGGGKVVEVEKETGKDGVVYEAEVKKTNGDTIEIKVASDGKLIKVEAEDEDDDDGGDEDEEENDDK